MTKWPARHSTNRRKATRCWESFRERYRLEALPAKAKATASKVDGVFNAVEAILAPQRLTQITTKRISYFQAEMRRRHKSESTIKGNLAHLKAALRWAERVGLLAKAPRVEMPKRAKGGKIMKGRPITLEEFERMLAKVPEVLGTKAPDSESSKDLVKRWQWFLRGLWFSGLRIGEALEHKENNDDYAY